MVIFQLAVQKVMDQYGEHHIKTKDMIVYTSADSVLQICAHENYFGLDELYRCCKIARELTMKDEWKVGRVIARPFVGEKKGEFKRTSNRHDYALKPFGKTVLNSLKDEGYDVISVGKINDIFDTEGITKAVKSNSSVYAEWNKRLNLRRRILQDYVLLIWWILMLCGDIVVILRGMLKNWKSLMFC